MKRSVSSRRMRGRIRSKEVDVFFKRTTLLFFWHFDNSVLFFDNSKSIMEIISFFLLALYLLISIFCSAFCFFRIFGKEMTELFGNISWFWKVIWWLWIYLDSSCFSSPFSIRNFLIWIIEIIENIAYLTLVCVGKAKKLNFIQIHAVPNLNLNARRIWIDDDSPNRLKIKLKSKEANRRNGIRTISANKSGYNEGFSITAIRSLINA